MEKCFFSNCQVTIITSLKLEWLSHKTKAPSIQAVESPQKAFDYIFVKRISFELKHFDLYYFSRSNFKDYVYKCLSEKADGIIIFWKSSWSW